MLSLIKNFISQQNIAAKKIDNVVILLNKIQKGINQMALNLDALTAEVEHTKGVQESAVVLLQKLTAELADVSAKLAATPKDVPVDTSGLDELVAKLKSSTDALAGAVAANSPVEPAPAPAPEVAPEAPAPVVDAPVEPAPDAPASDAPAQ